MEIKPGSKSHPYMPTGVPAIRDEMLETLGLEKLEDLIKVIPEDIIYKGHLDIPGPLNAEADLKQHVDGILDKNISCSNYLSFLGAGCYRHYVPAVCDEINSRSEFLTAYVGDTYSDHGKFQAFFEFCSMMAELLDMDVVSYPTFDGGQAVCSALRMAMRITGKRELLLPRTMNPEILSQVVDYCGKDAELKLVNYDSETGQLDIEDLERNVTNQTAAVFFENPSYLGFLEEKGREIINIAHKKNALSIVYTDPISLGILEPPSSSGADLVCGDIQPLGIHMHFGGGCAGFIASRDEERIINEYPTYLIGLAETKNGRGFGWGRALNWRTSHGSREKGKEYMGTAAGLWAITAAVYLALMGPKGMKEIGETIISRTCYAKELLASIGGINTTPFQSLSFKEFPVNFDSTGLSVKEINTRLLEYEIFGGKDLSSEFPELGQTALYCITEMITEKDIKKLTEALKSIVNRNRGKA